MSTRARTSPRQASRGVRTLERAHRMRPWEATGASLGARGGLWEGSRASFRAHEGRERSVTSFHRGAKGRHGSNASFHGAARGLRGRVTGFANASVGVTATRTRRPGSSTRSPGCRACTRRPTRRGRGGPCNADRRGSSARRGARRRGRSRRVCTSPKARGRSSRRPWETEARGRAQGRALWARAVTNCVSTRGAPRVSVRARTP